MRVVSADIWDTQFDGQWRVVPTNLGWRRDGCNVMGAGVAKQAAYRYPELSAKYGAACQVMGKNNASYLVCYLDHKLIMFPVKTLDEIRPHMSWKQKASLDLVMLSLENLADLCGDSLAYESVVIPMVGCGNGQLPPAAVFPKMQNLLAADNFTIVMESRVYKAYKEVY